MKKQPILKSARLLLRPLTRLDAPTLQQLAGRREIADTTISIPHPYSVRQARQWIAVVTDAFAKGTSIVFGMRHFARRP